MVALDSAALRQKARFIRIGHRTAERETPSLLLHAIAPQGICAMEDVGAEDLLANRTSKESTKFRRRFCVLYHPPPKLVLVIKGEKLKGFTRYGTTEKGNHARFLFQHATFPPRCNPSKPVPKMLHPRRTNFATLSRILIMRFFRSLKTIGFKTVFKVL